MPANSIDDNDFYYDVTQRRKFPHEITKVDPLMNSQLLEDFKGERTGFVQVGPQKYFFPGKYEKHAEHIYNFEVRPDDVWIVTYPRSGTTWTQELIWLLENGLDFKTALELPLIQRFPFFDSQLLGGGGDIVNRSPVDA